MKKKNLPTLTGSKEHRELMNSFLTAFKKRPELNLEKYIGQYEFLVVPRSLSTSDGKLSLESK